MSKNKKELIIESFQKMDLDMLDILLDENKTYQEAHKDVFLEKVHQAFLNFKKNLDTHLLPYKGICNSNECGNSGCKGYSFVGNNSKNHVDLIFDETADDINDIYHCINFKIFDKTVDLAFQEDIEIGRDEEAAFEPSVEFLIKSQKCKSAYEELMQYQHVIINKEVYLPWFRKHKELHDSFFLPPIFYSDFKKFYTLYQTISDHNEFLEVSEIAHEAIEEFEDVDISNELQLVKWLLKYEKAGDDLILFLYEDIDYRSPENSLYFEMDNLKFSTKDFQYIAKFKFLYDLYYQDMLDKYTTFSDEESFRYKNENSEMAQYVFSLSYHIEKRGIKL